MGSLLLNLSSMDLIGSETSNSLSSTAKASSSKSQTTPSKGLVGDRRLALYLQEYPFD